MFISDIALSSPQMLVYFHFRRLLNSDKISPEVINDFLKQMTDKSLLIMNLKSLLQKSMNNECICTYVNSAQFDEYWKILLKYIGLLPQPNFSNFELLAGVSLYYSGKKSQAATKYKFFLALKEQNDANQDKLDNALQGQKVDSIDCLAMYKQALLAQNHGTPGYVLIASICFWIASYFKYVINHESVASCYYQLSVQNFYCAHFFKDQCRAAINNVRFSPNKQSPPIINVYSFFYLLAAIEAGKIEAIIEFIKRKAGSKLLNKLEIDLAIQNAIKHVSVHSHEVTANDGCPVLSSTSIS
jgi:hypothetical protein